MGYVAVSGGEQAIAASLDLTELKRVGAGRSIEVETILAALPELVEQVEKQLNKLVDVIKVRTLEENNLIGRELMILKVNANNKTRQDIMTICEIMGAKVDDISPSSMTMELSDTPERLDTFQSMMRPFSILEVARTGVIAVQKGGGKI